MGLILCFLYKFSSLLVLLSVIFSELSFSVSRCADILLRKSSSLPMMELEKSLGVFNEKLVELA